jgi:glucokinase
VTEVVAASDEPREPQPAGGAGGPPRGPSGPPGYLAIDLSPSRLTAGLVDGAGQVVLRDRVATPPRNVWPALTQLVRRVLAANPSGVVPRTVGVTCPGPIDRLTGAMKPVGLPLWHDFPISRELGDVVGLPVALDTPGRGLALAELWCGQSASIPPGDCHFATLVVGDDVDGAVVIDGRLATGLTGNLGQFGHLIVEPDGQRCSCGAAGCLTAYAGAMSITRGTGRELRRTPPGTIERTGIMVARACASIAAMLDVHEVIVGGAVPSVLGAAFFDALDREFDQRSRLSHLDRFRVRGVEANRLGPLVAAAAVARRLELERPLDEPIPEPPPVEVFGPPQPRPFSVDKPAVTIIRRPVDDAASGDRVT